MSNLQLAGLSQSTLDLLSLSVSLLAMVLDLVTTLQVNWLFQPLIVLANLPLPTPIHSPLSLSTASLEQTLLGEALAAIDTGQVVDAVVEEVEGRRRSLLIPRRPDMSPGWTTSCCNVRQSAEAPSLVGRESGSLFAPQTPTSWLRPSRLGDPLVSLRPVPCPAPPQHLGDVAKTECWVGAELTTLLPIFGALYILLLLHFRPQVNALHMSDVRERG